MTKQSLSILPIRLGALPIVEQYINDLQIEGILKRLVTANARDKIPVWKTLSILLSNIILQRHPLYKIGQWALEKNLIPLAKSGCMTDDRIGRALDRLFDADRASLVTELVLKATDVFGLSVDRIHNDSTSITLNGEYTNYKSTKAAKPKRGINKDFRPDLRQLVFSLTVTGDGAIPLYFKVWDGNTSDDTTHLRNWMALRNLIGKSDFTYVADSKLCVKESMNFIDSEGGKFITVMPETRSEINRFKQWIQDNNPQWHETCNEKNPRGKHLPRRIFYTYDSPVASREGFRIIWVKSSLKQFDDEQRRTRKIDACEEELSTLSLKRHRNKEKLKKAVEATLNHYHAAQYFSWNISVIAEEQFKQVQRGRPDKNTQYRRIVKERYQLTWCQNVEQILFDSRYDGIFPLITNNAKITASEILSIYKYQPRLEKRFEQLKTVYNVAPVFLKNPQRIEALLTLYFVALLVTGLIERNVRNSMKEQKIESIPIYPEERACKSPTSDKILSLFSDIRLQFIMKNGKRIQTVEDEFSDIQKKVLGLLNISEEKFFSKTSNSGN